MTSFQLSNLTRVGGKIAAWVILSSIGLTCASAAAQRAVPFYGAEQVMQAFYQHSALPKATLFNSRAHALEVLLADGCDKPDQLLTLQTSWVQTMLAWEALQTPSVGALVERRTQRRIDFWPSRDKLVAKALREARSGQLDMDLVGSPAKGLPALAVLLGLSPSGIDFAALMPTSRCTYAVAVAADIAAEAADLLQAVSASAQTDWATDAGGTQAAWEQLINQWLGGLERLRWSYINKPIQMALTSNDSLHTAVTSDSIEPTGLPLSAIGWPRPSWQLELQAVQVQWAQLHDLATSVGPGPTDSKDVIGLQTLLQSRGYVALADTWGESVQQVHVAINQLGSSSNVTQLQAVSQQLGSLAHMYQSQLAPAFGVQMGFSDADGD